MQQDAAIDLTKLAAQFLDYRMWIFFLLVAFAGGLGGVARKKTAPGSDLTTLSADIVIGAITALAMLIVIPTDNAIKVLSFSIVAGYAGKSLLDALEARTQKLVAEQKQQAAVQAGLSAVREARNTLTSARPMLRLADDRHQLIVDALKDGTVEAPSAVDTSALDRIEGELNSMASAGRS